MIRTLSHLVPNGLSGARLVLGVAFPFIPAEWRLWAVIGAALSDLLDGLTARWMHAESNAGRLLDPVADKVFVLALVATLLAEGALHPLWALGLAIRDVTVLVGLVYVIARRQWGVGRRMRPSLLGKATTAAQFVVLALLVMSTGAPMWVLAAVTFLSALAAWDYARWFWGEPSVGSAAHSARELTHERSP
ncbi:CDP-alcohol phosphatidyltransferase family protein [Gemmata sp. G18]|uniref:CDP-diacylglycerol--glycerol-3-phosphate 3-phosphatidyltransferase n=1 Tax=Gemmata palustris TaxID=2822762 RepID=A0ABS5BY34_9BACT|nr:CDP-alcohol phosphatidyltransferase family protein [Gemmata palustris]MBP3958652.1 CDP-alcohol phosphatidyltransferase family protein [Gemmata palustris]